MARQEIDIGIEGNDGTGDSIRESFRKVNTNFQELYAVFGLGGTISFTSLDDVPDTYVGNEHSVPLANQDGTALRFYKFVSDSGANNNNVSSPSESTNSVFVEFVDPDPAFPNTSGTVKISIVDPHINRDPDPNLTAPLNMEAVIGYSNGINTKLRNTSGSGDDINSLVAEWNTTHPGASSINVDNVLISKGYADDRYINTSGDTLTGHLNTVSGATGTQVPQVQEVITRAGSVANRTMLDTLFLADHPSPLEGFGTPNGADDLQAVTKLYVDTQGFSSTTNLFVSTSGDDKQTITPPGQEGRSQQYAYKTINAAMRRATEIIEATPFEPGPYVQVVTYQSAGEPVNSYISSVAGVVSPVATSQTAAGIVDAQKLAIQNDVIDFLDLNYPDLVYNEDTCRRDVGLILDSIKLDVQAGLTANYLSRWAGLRYNANPSAIKAKTLQYAATRDGIARAKATLNNILIAAGTISTPVIDAYDDRFDEILEYIDSNVSNDNPLVTGNSYVFDIFNGGNASVDQGIDGNKDLIEGKVIRGITSGAIGVIVDYQRAATATTDRLTVDLLEPIEFLPDEEIEYGNKTRNNQITIRVESGIYYEHLPIKLPENCSIKGDEFRRVVLRPKPGVSQSIWANTYFYRDINTDSLISAYSPITTIANVSAANPSRAAGTYNIAANDYATTGIGRDATFTITVDGSGAASVSITNGGDGFIKGETITISDSDLGGGGAPSLTFDVLFTGGGYHFTHPISGKQGKYGYHYLVDPSLPKNVGTSAASNPGGFDEAAKLIEANKAFIAEEVIQWIDAQIAIGTGIWSGFSYNSTKCRRDTNLILDGIINDLKEGGREATLTNQAAYYSGAVAGQEQQTAAALTYIKTIAANVLDNDSGAPFAKLGLIDQVFDAELTAETGSDTQLDALVDCVVFAFDPAYNPPLSNAQMDVLLCNDGTIVRNLTVQRHGGFMMVLDPEGQILTRSPYCQTGSSFSQSKGVERNFAGGLFIDGYAGNMPATVDTVNSAFSIDISSPSGEGLFVRRPPTPFPFFYNGARYQVNTVTNYNQTAGTCRLILDETSNSGTGWTSGTGIDIFIQSGGNRSMLANDFTQINDLGFGCLAVNNALSELVSMFTYYCHTGYMAKDGSQIRSIAGNNSYGIYGLVAEGSDPDEIATEVTLNADMVFPAKTFRASHIISFASAIPGTITAGETISQEISGATAVVSFVHNGGKDVYVHSLTGIWNTSDTAYGDDSTTLIGVPTATKNIDASAATGSLFVYAYDLAGLPNNVSEVEILHDETGSGLYQPYEITNATKNSFILDGFKEVNDTIAATYTGAGPETSKATFTVTKDRTNGYRVAIEFGGAGYSASETFTVAGNLLGGATPANNATITITTVDGTGKITAATIAGTPAFDATSPVLNGQVWRFNLGTGIEGTAENGLQVDTTHNTKMVVRHKQNFVVDGLPAADLPVRPSTAFIFTDDYDQFTYRTIAFTNQITDGFTTGLNQRVVTFDSNFRYLDLTTYQNGTVQGIAIAENSAFLTVDPNYTDIIAAATPNPAKTLGSLAGDRFIAINELDTVSQGRIAAGELIFAWGGKVHVIDSYAEYEYDDGVGAPVTIGVIGISDQSGSDINWPATSAGLGLPVTNTRGVTLKGGLVEGEDASITVNISTCRATGHDMLDIGVGGYNTANYPERIYGAPYGLNAVSTNDAIDSEGTRSAAQVQERNKGRVFAVLTDQDGFFRVGRFFTVDQGTGSVTFNAALVLTNIDGIGFKRGVRVNEFSNDDTFSDPKGDAVPTQTAVYGYINYRLGFDENGNLVGGAKIGPGVMSLGGPGFAQTPMQDNMNLGSNRITNLALPLTGSDAANKTYVDSKTDELNDIGDVTISPSVGITANILGFTGTGSNSENMVVDGDIGFTYTGANSLTASISAGVIVDADINASAAIAQSKLALNDATAAATAGAAVKGIASFDSANFETTSGWVGIKAQGISASELNNTLDLSGKTVTLANGEISNAELANSSITVGTTTISLGSSSTTLAGMTGITFSSGNITGVAQISHTGNITGPVNSGADNGVSLGSNTNRYNTIWATTFNGTATEALYADLAENYLGDADYEPGTVLVFGGDAEVTVCSAKGDRRVAGVVTTNPAHLMNSHLKGEYVVGVALTGRVPCKVIGKVDKGDILVTSAVPGYAIVDNDPRVGAVIGKAVGTKDNMDRGVVEVVVGRV